MAMISYSNQLKSVLVTYKSIGLFQLLMLSLFYFQKSSYHMLLLTEVYTRL